MRRRIVARFALAVFALALTFGPLAPTAEAHASCNGADHTHRIVTIRPPFVVTQHWDFWRTRSLRNGRYENLYHVRETGRWVWSAPC